MPVTANDIRQSAINIKAIASEEAAYRACISRYYYAAFHASKDFHGTLARPGNTKANVGDHENLVHMLSNPAIPNTDAKFTVSKEISIYLKKSLFNRRLADYQLNQTVTEKNLNIVETETNLIFDTISTAP
jgi:uncharacterized protein (UPF0332 family)